MSSFTDRLDLDPLGPKLWRVTRGFGFWVGTEGSGAKFIVPAEFRTDLGTVPRAFWWIVRPDDGTCAAAFVLHDWLCDIPGFAIQTADALLLEAMRVLNVPPVRRTLIYAGVRAYHRVRYFGQANFAG